MTRPDPIVLEGIAIALGVLAVAVAAYTLPL